VSESHRVRVRNWRAKAPNPDQPGEVESSDFDTIQDDSIAAEVPIAFSYNRVSYVVMMATPRDLEDFAFGFSFTEGIVGGTDDILGVKVIPRPGGIELAMTIEEDWFDRLATRRRNMAGRTGCGLCGAENIEQALRYPEPVANGFRVSDAGLQRAVSELEEHQPMQAETGATHGAAWCDLEGRVVRVREDVGRHNALDKLIGSLCRDGFEPSSGFVLVSSRASYEMVYKTAVAGIQLILAVSAPTTLAVEFAQRTGVTLAGFARPGRHNVYTFPERITSRKSPDAGS
jgi:FdhD protein